jgi:RNA-dependent RNA polymerase
MFSNQILMEVKFPPLLQKTCIHPSTDTAMLFWSKLLVEGFRNAPISEPPANLYTRIFHCEVEAVAQFAHRVSQLAPSASQKELQTVSSLAGLTDTKVGLLSIFHDNAVYKHGYGSEQAQLMAHV